MERPTSDQQTRGLRYEEVNPAAQSRIQKDLDVQGQITIRGPGCGCERAISPQTATYNANDQTAGNGYDSNGNTLTAGGRTFAYDSMDRMTSFNGGAVTMVYDGDGNRVAKTAGGVTTEYLIDDSNPTGLPQVAEEVVGGAVARRYVYGTNRISQTQAGTTSLYDYDAHDDVRALMSATPLAAGGYPTPTDTYDYDAFGNIVGSTGTTPNVYRYQGEALDAETGLYYLRARYYDPVAGRFLSVDPMTDQGEHPYTYVGADPGNGHDPTGKANAIEYALVLAYFTPALFHVPLIPDRISRMGGIMFSNGTGGSVQDATVRQCKASPPRPAGAGQARRDGRRLAAPRVLPTNGGSLCV